MIVLLNPHKNHLYGKVKQQIEIGKNRVSKLKYFFEAFIKVPNTGYLIDHQNFPDHIFSIKVLLKSIFLKSIFIKEWEYLNEIKITKPLVKWNELTDKDTIIMSAKDLKYNGIRKKLIKTKVQNLLLLTYHYGSYPDIEYAALLSFKGKIHLVSELSLTSKPLIKKFLPPFKRESSFGYCIDKKFNIYKNFSDRKQKALAIGTINLGLPASETVCKYLNSMRLENTHHYRTQLYYYSKNSKMIDAFFNARNKHKIPKDKSKLISDKYHFYDLNKLLNSYKIVLLPPDSYFRSAQLIFEAMGSGCVVVTMPDRSLKKLGIIEQIHYVPFDFQNNISNLDLFLKNLLKKKEYLKKIHLEAFKISKNFRKEKISIKVMNMLKNIEK